MNKMSFFLIILFMSGCAALQSPQQTNIAVSTLLDEVQIAVNEISKKTQGSSLPKFNRAEITLATEAGRNAEGKASLYLSAKGSSKNIKSNKLVLVLEPNLKSEKILSRTSGQEIADYVSAAVSAIDEKEFLKRLLL